MENMYRNLMEDIRTPAGLNDRVLLAAKGQMQRRAKEPGPKRLAPRRIRPVLRGAVCAACALALVLGTVRFYPTEKAPRGAAGVAVAALPAWSFGLTAYAADTGESYAPNANGGLAFSMGSGMYWAEKDGYYTGCLFQVTGENIRQVALSLDRGGLYRWQRLENLTEEQMREIREAQERGELAPASIDQEADGSWSTEKMTKLGSSVTEEYDPAVCYGLWTGGVREEEWKKDAKTAEEDSVDQLAGAVLTVTVTFDNGSEQTETYRLSTGRLRVDRAGDGTLTVLPGLAGDDEAYLYGVYAASQEESRWFQWPVQDCTTISLSNPFGSRAQPGGETQTFHNGIDIPAPWGSVILAAADGTVTEIGFDAERGNYLVLDHGDGLETVYAICRDFTVKEGDTLRAGEMLGAVGTSGMSTGAHLCFQVWQDGQAQNPVAYFDSGVRDTLTAK